MVGGTAAAVAVLGLFGVDVVGWFESLWDALTGIGFGYLVAGWTLQTLKTTLTNELTTIGNEADQ